MYSETDASLSDLYSDDVCLVALRLCGSVCDGGLNAEVHTYGGETKSTRNANSQGDNYGHFVSDTVICISRCSIWIFLISSMSLLNMPKHFSTFLNHGI